MIKTDIISGFLGAGKTTLIKKLLADVYSKKGEKIVIIENEFGKVGIDGGFLKEAGVQITEMNSGCICCSLVGDFGKALKKVVEDYSPDRIIIEPSGVGKLSDVAEAVRNAGVGELSLNCMTAVIDATKCRMYLRNFAEFYKNQIEFSTAIILSRTAGINQAKLDEAIALIREINPTASLVTTAWDEIDGEKLLSAMENTDTAMAELEKMLEEHKHEHHHHHHHHHHHDGEECDDPDCECHHHHDADEVFVSCGFETAKTYDMQFVEECLERLDSTKYGIVLRAKGILPSTDGKWIHFDFVPGERNVRYGSADITGKICIIGSGIDKELLKALWNI